jgi:hypothetical protein
MLELYLRQADPSPITNGNPYQPVAEGTRAHGGWKTQNRTLIITALGALGASAWRRSAGYGRAVICGGWRGRLITDIAVPAKAGTHLSVPELLRGRSRLSPGLQYFDRFRS